MDKIYDLIIVGSGPAGLSAAIYSARANLKVLIIEAEMTGGKIVNIHQIDNYPGFDTISGFDLAQKLINQAKQYDIEFVTGKVINVKNNELTLASGKTLQAKAILIATGSKQRKLDLPQAQEYTGKGISYCATCDGFFFRNKDVCVIGDNKEASQEALYLLNLVNKLTIVSRHNSLIGDTNVLEKFQNEKVNVILNATPTKLLIENDKLIGLQIYNQDKKISETINCEGIFPYIDFNPATSFVDESILDDNGFIVVDDNMATTIPGLYAAGDCIKKNLRQVVTACADGAIAATSIIKYLKK